MPLFRTPAGSLKAKLSIGTCGGSDGGRARPGSDRRERMRRVSDGLGRLAENANETAAHSLAVAENCRLRYLFNGQASLFQHQPGCFKPEIFDGSGGRLSRLDSEYAAELARTEPGGLGK